MEGHCFFFNVSCALFTFLLHIYMVYSFRNKFLYYHFYPIGTYAHCMLFYSSPGNSSFIRFLNGISDLMTAGGYIYLHYKLLAVKAPTAFYFRGSPVYWLAFGVALFGIVQNLGEGDIFWRTIGVKFVILSFMCFTVPNGFKTPIFGVWFGHAMGGIHFFLKECHPDRADGGHLFKIIAISTINIFSVYRIYCYTRASSNDSRTTSLDSKTTSFNSDQDAELQLSEMYPTEDASTGGSELEEETELSSFSFMSLVVNGVSVYLAPHYSDLLQPSDPETSVSTEGAWSLDCTSDSVTNEPPGF